MFPFKIVQEPRDINLLYIYTLHLLSAFLDQAYSLLKEDVN